MSKSLRLTLTTFRCGVYQLATDTGRYSGKLVEQRMCPACQSDKVEDEFHFQLLCPVYQKERIDLLSKVSQLVRVHVLDLPPNMLFSFLLTCKDICNPVVRFINTPIII